jgi:hypothetical protein
MMDIPGGLDLDEAAPRGTIIINYGVCGCRFLTGFFLPSALSQPVYTIKYSDAEAGATCGINEYDPARVESTLMQSF